MPANTHFPRENTKKLPEIQHFPRRRVFTRAIPVPIWKHPRRQLMTAAFPLHRRANEGPPEMTGLRLAFRHGTDRMSSRLACSGREGADGVRSLPAALVLRPVPADMRILGNPGAMFAERAVHLAFIFTIAQLVIIDRIPSCVAGARLRKKKAPARGGGSKVSGRGDLPAGEDE